MFLTIIVKNRSSLVNSHEKAKLGQPSGAKLRVLNGTAGLPKRSTFPAPSPFVVLPSVLFNFTTPIRANRGQLRDAESRVPRG